MTIETGTGGPMRSVVKAKPKTKPTARGIDGKVLASWVLTLECGHEVRVTKNMAIAACPKRARCPRCGKNQEGETNE